MAEYRKLWWLLIAILMVTFGILGYFGREVYRQAPPIPGQVISDSGGVLMTHDSILDGQTAWQSVGGMQLGSIWGHGAYQAPDWTADWLHRELMMWLDLAARDGALHPARTLSDAAALQPGGGRDPGAVALVVRRCTQRGAIFRVAARPHRRQSTAHRRDLAPAGRP